VGSSFSICTDSWEFKNNNATWVIDEISQSETVQRNVQNSETVNIDTTSTDAQNCQKKNAPNFFPIKDGKNTFIDEMKNINTNVSDIII
jgi:hypothetical protein